MTQSKETQPAGEVRPLVERLRGGVYGIDRIALCAEAADEIDRLRAALAYARGGFELAYSAAEKGFTDETLLHCGHHGARADMALEPTPRQMAHE